MANPPKKKGTGGETEFARAALAHGVELRRMETNHQHDFERVVRSEEAADLIEPLRALATRPDRGQWLVTITAEDFFQILKIFPNRRARIEVKRWARFAHHVIFEKKLGGDRSAR